MGERVMEWYLGPLKKYAEFSGRASRKEYWLFSLWNLPIVFVLTLIALPLYVLYVLGILLPALAVGVRRLHDTNRSAWWLLLYIVPFGGIAVFVFLCLKGTDGDNDYGPDPLALFAASGAPVAAPPRPPVVGPGATPVTPRGEFSPPSEIQKPASSSTVAGAPVPPYQERPTIRMKPESTPEDPDQPVV